MNFTIFIIHENCVPREIKKVGRPKEEIREGLKTNSIALLLIMFYAFVFWYLIANTFMLVWSGVEIFNSKIVIQRDLCSKIRFFICAVANV